MSILQWSLYSLPDVQIEIFSSLNLSTAHLVAQRWGYNNFPWPKNTIDDKWMALYRMITVGGIESIVIELYLFIPTELKPLDFRYNHVVVEKLY